MGDIGVIRKVTVYPRPADAPVPPMVLPAPEPVREKEPVSV